MFGDAHVSKTCDFCNNIRTNYYCRYFLLESNVLIRNKKLKICRLASCFECKDKQGTAEDFLNWYEKYKNIVKIEKFCSIGRQSPCVHKE